MAVLARTLSTSRGQGPERGWAVSPQAQATHAMTSVPVSRPQPVPSPHAERPLPPQGAAEARQAEWPSGPRPRRGAGRPRPRHVVLPLTVRKAGPRSLTQSLRRSVVQQWRDAVPAGPSGAEKTWSQRSEGPGGGQCGSCGAPVAWVLGGTGPGGPRSRTQRRVHGGRGEAESKTLSTGPASGSAAGTWGGRPHQETGRRDLDFGAREVVGGPTRQGPGAGDEPRRTERPGSQWGC